MALSAEEKERRAQERYNLKEAAKLNASHEAHSWAKKYNLPDLIGTENQIRYAEVMRKEFMMQQSEWAKYGLKNTLASWWISPEFFIITNVTLNRYKVLTEQNFESIDMDFSWGYPKGFSRKEKSGLIQEIDEKFLNNVHYSIWRSNSRFGQEIKFVKKEYPGKFVIFSEDVQQWFDENKIRHKILVVKGCGAYIEFFVKEEAAHFKMVWS